MGNGGCGDGSPGEGGAARPPHIPPPRPAAEDGPWPPAAPAGPEPTGSASTDGGPGHPGTADPGRPDSDHADAGTADPGRAAPGTPDPARADSDHTDSDHAEWAGTPPGPAGGSARPGAAGYDHGVLKSLLGAWALAACSAEETAAIEAHLTDCAGCADEALRLRDAVGLLHPEDGLDLDPMLRSRVLEGCLLRRPARIPLPAWAAPYDAETARLDALLHDMAEDEWRAPVRLRWFDGEKSAERATTVAGVLGHLLAVDGLPAAALGLPDPLAALGLPRGAGPAARTEAQWRAALDAFPAPPGAEGPAGVRSAWRAQGHALLRTVPFGGDHTPELPVSYGDFTLPLRDAFLDRAFECWVHAGDIAEAVDYPYDPPAGPHLHLMVDLAARLLPETLAARRRAGLAGPSRRLAPAGAHGRALHLEIEGDGGGHWYIPLDSPAAATAPEDEVAHVALDGMEFCQLAAGHVAPQEAAAGQQGDREAIRDVLFAAASLSRL